MYPLPLLLESLPIKMSPRKGNLWFPTFVLFLLVATNSFSQRSYYEYNNPDAVKINKKVMDQLTSAEWVIKNVRWLIRKDTFDYQWPPGSLTLHNNGTYSSRRSIGTWLVKYNRYLVLTDTTHGKHMRGISGTFGVTAVSDSILVLTQLHTSSRDMLRTMTLVKEGDKYATGRSRAKRYMYRQRFDFNKKLDPYQLDSISFFSKEELFLYINRVSKDTIFINTPDSLYKLRVDVNDPLRKVKVFSEDERLEDYEAMTRFTLADDQIQFVDSLVMGYIMSHRDDYPRAKIMSLDGYFRQYVGYVHANGDNIIFLNAFCTFDRRWRHALVSVEYGGPCYFNISINLTKKEAFSFHVNDF